MRLTRRTFLQTASLAAVAPRSFIGESPATPMLLEEFAYGDISLDSASRPERQFRSTQALVMSLNEDALLRPFRQRAGQPTPGPALGGWYDYVEPNADTDAHRSHDGFCPGHAFGQWISSMARTYAIDRDPIVRQKIERLLALYEPTITPDFYKNFRFPAYVYDKLNIGLIDAYRLAGVESAKELFARTTAAASQHLPPRPLSYDEQMEWRKQNHEHMSQDFTYDESYTLPENLFLATRYGLGDYRAKAERYLLDTLWFDPLSRNQNVLAGKHAYSYCNSLNSGVQAFLSNGNDKYLQAATNGLRMIQEQSFATGGWGPGERFLDPASDLLYSSVQNNGSSFETPCGSYAHFKLTRSLMRLHGDAAYGDSMEQVLFNTVLGALPLQADGRTFYYADYHNYGKKTYHANAWPCCSGTLPQVTADYRLLTYLRDDKGIFVNLYLPSQLKFQTRDGVTATLRQMGTYPLDEKVTLHLELTRPSAFAMRVRVPSWCKDCKVRLNGHEQSAKAVKGWATLERHWHSGDTVQLTFAMPLRTEPISPRHPHTVALMRGPLVLFPLDDNLPQLSRTQLFAAVRHQDDRDDTWAVNSPPNRQVILRPFTSIGDEVYSTYLETVDSPAT